MKTEFLYVNLHHAPCEHFWLSVLSDFLSLLEQYLATQKSCLLLSHIAILKTGSFCSKRY